MQEDVMEDEVHAEDLKLLRDSLANLSGDKLRKLSLATAIKEDVLQSYRDGTAKPETTYKTRSLTHWARVEVKTT